MMGFIIRYAIKMVKIRGGEDVARLLREVNTLSRMHHEHIVRYYQASGSSARLMSHGGSDCCSHQSWVGSDWD